MQQLEERPKTDEKADKACKPLDFALMGIICAAVLIAVVIFVIEVGSRAGATR